MLQETIKRIEREIVGNKEMSEQKRNQLISLLKELRSEVELIKDTHSDEASSIMKMTEASVQVASRKTRDQELLEHSLEGMKMSARSFEVSHPKLIGLINSIGQTLSNLGI